MIKLRLANAIHRNECKQAFCQGLFLLVGLALSFLPFDVAIAGMVSHELSFAGESRLYYVYVPSTYDDKDSAEVVFGLHGYTSTATGFAAAHGLDRHAERHGYIAVFPQGTWFTALDPGSPDKDSQLITSWNDRAANLADGHGVMHCLPDSFNYPCPPTCGDCSRCMWTSCGDDLGYLNRVLADVTERYNTDTDRYYLLGVSNGAMMALRWACNNSDEFAAIASIIGQLAPGFACQPTTNLPLMHLTGAMDDVVREDGAAAGDGFIYETAEKTQAHWAAALGCQSEARWRSEDPLADNLNCSAWSDCEMPSHEVIGCSDPTGTHQWPGARIGNMSAVCVTSIQRELFPGQPDCITASDSVDMDWGVDLVWRFFNRYQLGMMAVSDAGI